MNQSAPRCHAHETKSKRFSACLNEGGRRRRAVPVFVILVANLKSSGNGPWGHWWYLFDVIDASRSLSRHAPSRRQDRHWPESEFLHLLDDDSP